MSLLKLLIVLAFPALPYLIERTCHDAAKDGSERIETGLYPWCCAEPQKELPQRADARRDSVVDGAVLQAHECLSLPEHRGEWQAWDRF